MTGDEFLAWDATQTERHDLVDGEVHAMAGAEDRHVTATGNVYMALRQHLVEVLSPSTAAYDRGEKFAHYRQISSLAEVAFIDLDSRRTDVFRKGADGLWVLHPFERGQTIELSSVGRTLTEAVLFAEVG